MGDILCTSLDLLVNIILRFKIHLFLIIHEGLKVGVSQVNFEMDRWNPKFSNTSSNYGQNKEWVDNKGEATDLREQKLWLGAIHYLKLCTIILDSLESYRTRSEDLGWLSFSSF